MERVKNRFSVKDDTSSNGSRLERLSLSLRSRPKIEVCNPISLELKEILRSTPPLSAIRVPSSIEFLFLVKLGYLFLRRSRIPLILSKNCKDASFARSRASRSASARSSSIILSRISSLTSSNSTLSNLDAFFSKFGFKSMSKFSKLWFESFSPIGPSAPSVEKSFGSGATGGGSN